MPPGPQASARCRTCVVRCAVAVVRGGEVAKVEGDAGQMNAASLAKQVIAHLAMEVLDDLDQLVWSDVTARHVLSHTSGLPNWRSGDELVPLRPPGVRWGYSGEGIVLLQTFLEERTGRTIDVLAREVLLGPLGLDSSNFGDPEPGYHGLRPLMTTASDYATFLAFVLRHHDERWTPQCTVTDRIAWGLGWGLEFADTVNGWQWGWNDDASNFVIGSPHTGDGVVVFTDSPDGPAAYSDIVRREFPGDHPSLDVWTEPSWIELW